MPTAARSPGVADGALSALLATLLLTLGAAALGREASPDENGNYCGQDGLWLQVLGAGGPEIDDGGAGPAYLVWLDGRARVMIDTGPGAAYNFDRARADFEDLVVIAFTHLHVDHVGDLPALLKGSYFLQRRHPLVLLGPTGNDLMPGTEAFVKALFDPDTGPYRYMADFLDSISGAGYKLAVREVLASGRRPWSQFQRDSLKLSAIPVGHGPLPALAWRVELGGMAITFTGDASNRKQTIEELALGSDVLVVHHAIPEQARGEARELHMPPSQIGKLAAAVDPRFMVLSHRMNRTRGRESRSRDLIREHWDGTLIFANDMDCFGIRPPVSDDDAPPPGPLDID